MTGTLFLVATPIGNLEDITLRALRILRQVDCVLAEDTRHSRTLLSHHGIQARVESLHAHTSQDRIAALAFALSQGQSFALISDAGSPLISDPGASLVEAAIAQGVTVDAIPGPSAVIAALSLSGLRCDDFRFMGFLPRGGKRRRAALLLIARDPAATVLFESARRVSDTLQDVRSACGDGRRATVCRELTKVHQEIARGTLAELCERFPGDARGEITVVVAGAGEAEQPRAQNQLSATELDSRIDAELTRGRHTKEIAATLAAELSLDPRDAYRRVVARKRSV